MCVVVCFVTSADMLTEGLGPKIFNLDSLAMLGSGEDLFSVSYLHVLELVETLPLGSRGIRKRAPSCPSWPC